MKIAIVGSGISGLVAAHKLHRDHDVAVFESESRIGGHTNTVRVELGGESHWIDTGFIVFNDWTYPNFIALLDELKVPSRATSMSFSVRCDRTGLEYNGTSLNGLFAQRRNLLRPRFYRLLTEILRFNREAVAALAKLDEQTTVGQFLAAGRYSDDFAQQYLYPMGAAIWSCPTGTFAEFPMRFIVEFYKNHGLLNVADRPTWRVVEGGSRSYVEAITRPFADRLRVGTPVERIERTDEGVTLSFASGGSEQFDHVVLACHSDQALALLAHPTAVERQVLGAIPYERNTAVLHTDASLLPRSRRAWASWNYHVRVDEVPHATVTYHMNQLQHLQSQYDFCVSLNCDELIDPAKVIRRFVYSHPVFTTERFAAQRRHAELLTANRTSFCGAYWGNGFHEDGVKSALAVCGALERMTRPQALTSSACI
ncbi:MAG: FAD-dependent oxidoreductase [Pirellulales bacterium]